jgi:WD40 repeat protein
VHRVDLSDLTKKAIALVISDDGTVWISAPGMLLAGDPWRSEFKTNSVSYASRNMCLSGNRLALADEHEHKASVFTISGDTLGSELPLPLDDNETTCVSFLGDGSHLLTGGHDRNLYLWDLTPIKQPKVIGRHTREIWKIAVSKDDRLAATVGDDRWLALWNIEERRLVSSFQAEGPMMCLAVNERAELLVSGDEAGRPIVLRMISTEAPAWVQEKPCANCAIRI